MCCRGVFFVTIGLQLDAAQILSAPLAVLAWLVVLVPVKILLNTLVLAGDAPVRPRCPARGHSVSTAASSPCCCWARSCSSI